MLSLDNAMGQNDVINFIEKTKRYLNDKSKFIQLIAEPKIDGLSIALRYKNGKFSLGATRGDGTIGEDVTTNLSTINDIPKNIPQLSKIDIFELRGEIYMEKKDFLNLNNLRKKDGESLFANPRNAAAGSLRQLSKEIVKKRNLRFFAYSYGELSKEIQFEAQSQFLEKINNYGFRINLEFKLCNNINDIENFYNKILNARNILKYDIDGIVYKINNFNIQNRLGFVDRSPRWAIARKFPAEKVTTTIKNIIIQVGRTGVLTPVAELNPVIVSGVKVSRVSLHNQDEIDRKDIRIGDTIELQRAGDVIPQVVSVDKKKRNKNAKKFLIPSIVKQNNEVLYQRSDHADTKYYTGADIVLHAFPDRPLKTYKKNDEVAVRCSSGTSLCKAQQLGSLEYFVSRDAFNIEGLGGKNLEKFWKEGFIKYPYDIFYLSKYKNKIINKEGFGEKSYFNLINSINSKKKFH